MSSSPDQGRGRIKGSELNGKQGFTAAQERGPKLGPGGQFRLSLSLTGRMQGHETPAAAA